MTAWTSDELDAIAAADELRIAPRKPDGTLRGAVPIWVVRHGDDLYVRSFKGGGAAWYRGTQATHTGHIESAAWPGTSRSPVRRTPVSVTRSTPPTAPSTAITARALSTRC